MINNQKLFIEEYCKKKACETNKVYIDNGYSGFNFNRPAFKKLLDDIEGNKINTVINDISRLGRDILQVQYYIESYFPSKKVKLIIIKNLAY